MASKRVKILGKVMTHVNPPCLVKTKNCDIQIPTEYVSIAHKLTSDHDVSVLGSQAQCSIEFFQDKIGREHTGRVKVLSSNALIADGETCGIGFVHNKLGSVEGIDGVLALLTSRALNDAMSTAANVETLYHLVLNKKTNMFLDKAITINTSAFETAKNSTEALCVWCRHW